MIIYRKGAPVRIRRSPAPAPPWWFATAIAPYAPRRAAPVAIDYLDLRATAGDRLEVGVADDVRDHLERISPRIEGPVLVDAAEFAEVVFRRGGEILTLMSDSALPSMALVSTRGAVPAVPADVFVLAAWPPDVEQLEQRAGELRDHAWGMVVPVLFPVTTSLAALDDLCAVARRGGAKFFAALPIDPDATAKQAIAHSLTLDDDGETYQHLFHADLEPVHVASERHIAALAAESGMADFVVPPRWEEKSNWNAAVLLTLTATRMLAMEASTELAGTIARSARAVAALEKPLVRIAAAASLSIVESLDEASVDILSDWLEGRLPAFVESVNTRWRLRRDAGLRP